MRDPKSGGATSQYNEREGRYEVRYFDDSVSGSGSEPFVSWFDGDGSDPAEMAGDDPEELPLGVIVGFEDARFFAFDEGRGEEGGGSVGSGSRELECLVPVAQSESACKVRETRIGREVRYLVHRTGRLGVAEEFPRGLDAAWLQRRLLARLLSEERRREEFRISVFGVNLAREAQLVSAYTLYGLSNRVGHSRRRKD